MWSTLCHSGTLTREENHAFPQALGSSREGSHLEAVRGWESNTAVHSHDTENQGLGGGDDRGQRKKEGASEIMT